MKTNTLIPHFIIDESNGGGELDNISFEDICKQYNWYGSLKHQYIELQKALWMPIEAWWDMHLALRFSRFQSEENYIVD